MSISVPPSKLLSASLGLSDAHPERIIYLINHELLPADCLQIDLILSQCIVRRTIDEFHAAAYNDFIAGELFNTEEIVKNYLYPDEYYLSLQIPPKAIDCIQEDGHVLIHPGYMPKVLMLKTADQKNYYYDDKLKSFENDLPMMLSQNSRTYNYDPQRWARYNRLKNSTLAT